MRCQHVCHASSVPRHTHTFAHTQAESLNCDIQDRAIITRQMSTWRRSGLGRGAERSRATEVMISGTKRQTWEGQVRESRAAVPHNTTGVTLENFLEHSRIVLSFWLSSAASVCVCVSLCVCVCVCVLVRVQLCVSMLLSKADVSSGEENPRNWLLYHWGYLPILGINIFNSPS